MQESKIDYYQGFKHCLENALHHLEVAELSKDISFGIAHAHVVLASEEAVKAMMLFNIHFDNDILTEMDDFHLFFSDHKHKHETIRNVEHIGILLEKMLTIRWAPFVEIADDSISLEEFNAKRDEGYNNLIQWITELTDKNNKQARLDTNDNWWRQAESYKKEGFYINLLKKKGQWTGPFKCSRNQYNKGRKIVLKFIEKVQVVEEHIKNPNAAELYWKMKK